ncbi:fimbria/pilus periplasmic chaperone [Proteus mirabilis]|uniref:fimbria/pilus periplasmic chaperone n=1 Tax=Proteus mirabilis TaxID=584 RepID=UPI0039B61C22
MLFLSKKVLFTLLVILNIIFTNTSYSSVSLGATRVVYISNAKQETLSIINSSKTNRYLINSWVTNEKEQKTNDFIVTPPLFAIETDSENTIKIIKIKNDFPVDRESVYFLNVKSIPSVDKDDLNSKNMLQIAVLSRIKLFVRPSELKMKPEDSYDKIKITKGSEKNTISIINPTPYYINMVDVYIKNKKQNNMMIPPYSQKEISGVASGNLKYKVINDYGALTQDIYKKLDN